MNTRNLLILLALFNFIFYSCEKDNNLSDVGIAKVSFADDTYRGVEGASEALSIPVGANTPYHSAGTVTIKITGGEYGVDYTTSSESDTVILEFADNSVTENLSIMPVDDNIVDADLVLELKIIETTGGLEVGDIDSLQLVLLNDDEVVVPGVKFDPDASYEIEENSTTSLQVDILLDSISTAGGTITIKADGRAVFGEDYTIEGQDSEEFTLNVEEYGDSASFNVLPIDNEDYEGNKEILFVITEVSGGLEIAGTNSTKVTIIEDDPSPFGVIDFSADNQNSADEAAGSVTLNFDISKPLSEDASVSIAINESSTATLGEDFTFADGSVVNPHIVNLASGATTASITLMILEDEIDEDDETIILDIVETTGGLEVGSTNPQFVFTISGNNGGGGSSTAYVETFESSTSESTLQVPYNYTVELLSGTTVANPESSLFSLNNAGGKFADLSDVSAASDWGAQMGYVNKDDGETSTGMIDNVLISPQFSASTSGSNNVKYDIAFAKPNSTSVIEVYWSNNSNGTSFSNGDWTLIDTVDESNIGVDRNSFARRSVTINSGSDFYIAFRIKAEIGSTGSDNEGTRWRLDNIQVNNN